MKSMICSKPVAALATVAALMAGCAPPDGGREERLADAYLTLLAAEDARPTSGPELDRLIDGTHTSVVFLRRTAVRALGRLENPELVDQIAPLLDDPVPAVRAEAANALAQAVHNSDGEAVVDTLLERAAVEQDSLVIGAIARALGRSATSPARRARVSEALVAMSYGPNGDAPLSTLVGVALGFESLVRGSPGRGLPGDAAVRLVELAEDVGGIRSGPDAERLRGTAISALGQARRLDRRILERSMQDRSDPVQVLATRNVDAVLPAQRPELLRRMLGDGSYHVPLEGVVHIGRQPRSDLYCRYLFAALEPRVPPGIRVVAADALARPCPQLDEQRRLLSSVVAELSQTDPEAWHAPAHALVALAQIAPNEAAPAVTGLATHPNPFARAYGARAAAAVDDAATLDRLVRDEVANVRTAAISGLVELRGHAVDDVLIEQLSDDDPQLLMTAARLLEGSPLGVDGAESLLTAFERISNEGRETWRDSRRALLARIGELGDASLSARLVPFLADYDPLVADDVSTILTTWTGELYVTEPEPLVRQPLPTTAELLDLDGAHVLLHMAAGGTIVIELLPFEATTNVHRFVRLAESGYLDGLTFHRWAPNFVLQGGSPGANEFQGDGPYTRDEVGLRPHWRGTVGISTRGRDTGDGQIFFNLVDNVRLDHDYTLVGRVVDGMVAVDSALEGAVIERAEIRRAG